MPVDPPTLFAFSLAALAVVVSPGPDTMLILRHTLIGGRAPGLAAVAGVQVGIGVHTLLAVLGVSLLIASSPVLFKTIAVLGALYLGWIGIRNLTGPGDLAVPVAPPDTASRPSDLFRPFREAMLTNLLNPKVIVLFLALFPNFVDRTRADTTAQLLTLAFVLVVINVLWQAPMAFAAGWVKRWLGRPGAALWVARTTGVVFIGFALLMLAEHFF